MSIYHCSIKIGSRSRAKSAVAAAAYRSGTELAEEEIGKVYDYTRKGGVVYSEILLPANAPSDFSNREILWNSVQKIERSSKAQLFREVEVALPAEFERELQIQAVRQFVSEQFVSEGMCADFSIHDKGDGNPHAHIMLTTRPIKENGEWGAKEKKAFKLDERGERIPVIDPKTGLQKVRKRPGKGEEKLWERETVQANSWNDRRRAEEWRAAWADVCNQYLSRENQMDHRSYKRQGVDKIPTIHEGFIARKMGMRSERVRHNQMLRNIYARLKEIKNELLELLREQLDLIKGLLWEIDYGKSEDYSPDRRSEIVWEKKKVEKEIWEREHPGKKYRKEREWSR